MKTYYFVVPAPGHYGDRARVVSAHRTLAAAKRNAPTGYVVREGELRKGAEWLRSSESIYPVARCTWCETARRSLDDCRD